MADAGDIRSEGPAMDPRPSRRRLKRLWVVAVVASFVGIWGYAMYLTIFVGRAEPRDRLTDVEWRELAEEVCRPIAQEIMALPNASLVASPAERADLLDDATDLLESLVTRLDGLPAPVPADEARAVELWLADYHTYVVDRREYAAAQRDPANPRYDQAFSVTDRGGLQIDVVVDDFAHVNYMESCETPDDVG